MTSEESIYSMLAADAAVAAIVGSRIYPLRMPDDENAVLPSVVYTRVSGARATPMAGGATLENPRIQVDSWATTYAGAKALSEAVRAALEETGGTGLKAILLSDSDLMDDETGDYRVSMDFSVWHRLT